MQDPKNLLVFSDTHLTHLPDRAKLRFLLDAIKQADEIVINGDFWDGYITNFRHFTHSPHWQELFKALRAKNALYLHGNHDTAAFCGDEPNPFSDQVAEFYDFSQNGQRFHLEHGNRIGPASDESHRWIPRFAVGLASLADNLATRIWKHRFIARYHSSNLIMQTWQLQHMNGSDWLVCGHSHIAEVITQPHYANSGVIRGGIGSYLIIKDGIIKLHTGTY